MGARGEGGKRGEGRVDGERRVGARGEGGKGGEIRWGDGRGGGGAPLMVSEDKRSTTDLFLVQKRCTLGGLEEIHAASRTTFSFFNGVPLIVMVCRKLM